jgi:hypothetical protein
MIETIVILTTILITFISIFFIFFYGIFKLLHLCCVRLPRSNITENNMYMIYE